MPNFKTEALRKGREAIQEATENTGNSGDFRPFLPQIFWSADDNERYVLILNPIEEIPTVDFHGFIGIADQKFPEQAIARTDAIIGERNDPIQDTWKYEPKAANLMIAVELEPVYEQRGTRQKATGFVVKLNEFQRRLRDDEGELIEPPEYEDAAAPAVGYIAQSPFNFGSVLESIDASDGPIHSMALKITRLGEKTNVNYQVKTYEDIDVDLSPLIEYIEQVNYVTEPEELLEKLTGLAHFEAAVEIGNYLLYAKLNELADPDRYEDIFNRITEPSRYPKKDKKDKSEKTSRPARPTQRRGKADSEETTEEVTEKEEPVTRQSSARDRLKTIQAKVNKS